MENNHGFLKQSDPGFATKAIHVGQNPEKWSARSVVPPITMSTTFKQDSPTNHNGFVYGRSGNPTRDVLEECLASLEGGKYAYCFSSGLGVITTIVQLLNTEDHIVCGDDLYGGTNRLFRQEIARHGVDITFVDTTNPENVRNAIKSNTKLVWIETPTNPLLKVTDIKKVAEITNKLGVILAVDSTFLTSYFQRPLSLGADIVMHSLTKYLNGHSDVVMGAAILNRDDLAARVKLLQKSLGIVPSPFDCAMVNRSLKTLVVRMREHMKNGMAVAVFLESHPQVEKVIHPGLPSHPQHEVAKQQCFGHSGMVSFYLKGGLEESKQFLKALKVFTLAESLGGVESLAELPFVMTHASIPEDQRKALGITDNLIRLSVGLESIEDLVDDLDQALKSTAK